MTEKEWTKLLKSYKTSKQVADESLEGLVDHIETPCAKNQTQTVATPNAGVRGLPPFHAEPVVCDRGTRGCNLVHNDGAALRFARLSLERIVELEAKK